MLRENWSSTTISASRPRGVWAQESSSPLHACSSTSPKRSEICLSTSGAPPNHHCIWRPNVSRSASKMSSSGNQYERTSSGLLITISFPSVPLPANSFSQMPTYKSGAHPSNAPFLVIFRVYLFPIVGGIEGWEKFPNKGGGQAPQHDSGSVPPDKAPSSHVLLAGDLFYTSSWRIYEAPTFC